MPTRHSDWAARQVSDRHATKQIAQPKRKNLMATPPTKGPTITRETALASRPAGAAQPGTSRELANNRLHLSQRLAWRTILHSVNGNMGRPPDPSPLSIYTARAGNWHIRLLSHTSPKRKRGSKFGS